MKRVIICSVLLVIAVWMSIFAYNRVERVNGEFEKRLDALEAMIPERDNDAIQAAAHELSKYWENEEKRLIHFVRHSHIDLITTSVTRLPALAEHDEYGELHAELLNIRRQMRYILSSETLTPHNFL